MDIRKIKKLIELLQESGLAEMEVHEGEESVRLAQHSQAPVPIHFIPPSVPQTSLPVTTPQPETSFKEEAKPTKGHTVRSPMVGTAFLAPSPGAKPFVNVGDRVEDIIAVCDPHGLQGRPQGSRSSPQERDP